VLGRRPDTPIEGVEVVPTETPLTWTSYSATELLDVEGFHDRMKELSVIEEAWMPLGTLGGVFSMYQVSVVCVLPTAFVAVIVVV